MKRVRGGETGCLAQGDVNIALLVCLGLLGLFAAACGGSSSGSPNTESHLSGTVEGGTSPISGSRVTLYEAGDSAYGRGAKSLGTAITDANGTFNITYVAPKVPTVLYLLAEGGNAGGGTNSAVKLAAVVGLSTQLPAAAVVNEFSTIGLEWALRQFSDSSGAMIGAPTTNASGFGNAVNALGTNLVDLARGAPGSLLAGIASTCGNTSPAVNCGGLEQMNTLANILAACVVTGTNSVQCATLLEKATPPGGLTPLDTLTAAADIARNPTNNVSSLFALQRGSSPYQPALTSMPNDFSLALNFAQQAKFVLLSSLAVDALGNIWVTNFFGDPLSELTVASAYNNVEFFDPPSAELGHAITVALDDSNNVFVTNNLDHFSVSELTAASDYSAGFNFAPASAQFMRPAGIAIDTEGNLWVANEKGGSSGTGSISELIAPNYATDAANFSPAGANFGTPVSIALDAEGNVFVTNTNFNNNNSISELTAASGYETGLNFAPAAAALRIPSGISLDISNNIWVGGGNGVSELIAPDYGTNGAIFALPGVGSVSTTDPALDGSGNVWVPVSAVNGMSELTVASGYTNGITLSPPGSNISTPCCTAIDESGNLWNANLGTRSVTEIIGVAVPVRTPHKPGGPVLP